MQVSASKIVFRRLRVGEDVGQGATCNHHYGSKCGHNLFLHSVHVSPIDLI